MVGCEKDQFNETHESGRNVKTKTRKDKSSDENLIINELNNTTLGVEYSNLNYLILFYAEEINSTLSLTLTINDKLSENALFDKTIYIDNSSDTSKLLIKNQLLSYANQLDSTFNFDENELSSINLTLIDFSRTFISRNEVDSYFSSEVVQGLFYYSSIFKMINRKKEKNEESCVCHTFEWYLLGTSTFDCTEDIIYNTDFVYNYYANFNLSESQLDSLGLNAVLNYCSINKNTEISHKEINDLKVNSASLSYFGIEPTSGASLFWPRGSDLGCCGNYNWYCIIWTLECLRHDLACLNCDKWYCGPACEPGV